MRDDDPIETPPEGASCGEHPERDALVVCPRCGTFCCLACWHNSVRRCHACLMKDPGPPVAWEDRKRMLPMRFFATLADAFRPNRAAPALARSDWRRSISFSVLTFFPVAFLSGIIPYTYRLEFVTWMVRPTETLGSTEIAIDVARAGGIGIGIALGLLLLLLLPYYSLSRAYGSNAHPSAPISLMLYRAWLIPFSGLVQSLVVWSLHPPVSGNMELFVYVASSIWLVLLFSSMLSTARMASGVGPIASLAVVLIPFVVLMLGYSLGMQRLAPYLPQPVESSAEVGAER